MTSEEKLLVLESPQPRVPPARLEAHGHPSMEATDTGVVSWCMVPASRATTATRFCSRHIVRASASWSFLVVRAITFREPRKVRAASIALHQRRPRVKVLVQTAVVVFGRSREVREP